MAVLVFAVSVHLSLRCLRCAAILSPTTAYFRCEFSKNDPVLRVALIATPLFTGSIFYILENREREKLRKRQKKVNEQKYHAMFFNYLSWNPETKVRSPNWHTSVLKAMYREKMLGMLSSAVESIYLCNYHITLSTVYETLVAAYGRGIDVKVISDGEMLTEKLSVIEKLCKIGIPVKVNRRQWYSSLMHHKFCLIDSGVVGHELLWFGSLNLTLSGISNNWEDITVTSDPDIITRFSEEFHLLWDDFIEKRFDNSFR